MGEYEEQLEKLKIICSSKSKAPKYLDLSQKYGLRNSRWFIEHCNNPKVKDYNSFMEYEVGIMPNYLASKEMLIQKVLDFCKKNNRDNVYRKDFETGMIGFSVSTVQSVFGSMANMKTELGMKPHIGGIDRKKSIEYIKECIISFCNFIKSEHKNTCSFSQMNKYFLLNNMEIKTQTCQKRLFEEENISLRNFLLNNGIELTKMGRGLYFKFEDGEQTFSIYEYEFSLFLRNLGYIYNKDYFRDIKYSKFDNDVSTNINIDYIIYLNNGVFFVEIAGVLRDYENFYRDDREITSSYIKEKYRKSLKYKEDILLKNNLNYKILFPNKYKDFKEIILEKITL